VEEIVAVMRLAAANRHGWRLRAMIVVLWRAGLRVQEALALAEHDLDPRRGSVLVRNGKGGRRREVGMDEWGWEHLRPWLSVRAELPVGPLFCIIDGPTRGRLWSGAAVRSEFRRLAAQAGVRRRFAPHQLRHAHALELAREGVPLNIIQRQLGHANLGTTSIYLQGIDPEEIIATVRMRRAPMMSASAGLQL
jgi:site-specific recombinase XerD